MYKIGIVGLGVIYHQYIQALAKVKDLFHLVAVFDNDETKLIKGLQLARETLKREDIQGKNNLKAFLMMPEMDSVFIITPPSTHHDLAIECIQAGKNLLVEKPVACCMEDFIEMQELCSNHALQLHSAFHAAYASDLLWFVNHRKELESRYSLGQIKEISCGFYDPYVSFGKIASGRKVLGGSYLDSGVNELSVIACLVEIDSLQPKTHSVETLANSEIICKSYTELEGKAKLIVKMKTDWTLGRNEKSTIINYDNGAVLLNHSMQTVTLLKEAEKIQLFDKGKEPRLLTQYLNLLNDYASFLDRHQSNHEVSNHIHRLLYTCDLHK